MCLRPKDAAKLQLKKVMRKQSGGAISPCWNVRIALECFRWKVAQGKISLGSFIPYFVSQDAP